MGQQNLLVQSNRWGQQDALLLAANLLPSVTLGLRAIWFGGTVAMIFVIVRLQEPGEDPESKFAPGRQRSSSSSPHAHPCSCESLRCGRLSRSGATVVCGEECGSSSCDQLRAGAWVLLGLGIVLGLLNVTTFTEGQRRRGKLSGVAEERLIARRDEPAIDLDEFSGNLQD